MSMYLLCIVGGAGLPLLVSLLCITLYITIILVSHYDISSVIVYNGVCHMVLSWVPLFIVPVFLHVRAWLPLAIHSHGWGFNSPPYWCITHCSPPPSPPLDPELILLTGGMVLNDIYQYYDYLSALVSQCDHSPTPNVVIFLEISTPLRWTVWAAQLVDHPDQRFVDYILSGIHYDFHIGFCHSHPLQYTGGQNPHVPRPSVVSDYLACEVQLNRMWQCPPGCSPRGAQLA